MHDSFFFQKFINLNKRDTDGIFQVLYRMVSKLQCNGDR